MLTNNTNKFQIHLNLYFRLQKNFRGQREKQTGEKQKKRSTLRRIAFQDDTSKLSFP